MYREPIAAARTNERSSDRHTFAVLVTHAMGFLILKLTDCKDNVTRLCFECWTKECLLQEKTPSPKLVSLSTAVDVEE